MEELQPFRTQQCGSKDRRTWRENCRRSGCSSVSRRASQKNCRRLGWYGASSETNGTKDRGGTSVKNGRWLGWCRVPPEEPRTVRGAWIKGPRWRTADGWAYMGQRQRSLGPTRADRATKTLGITSAGWRPFFGLVFFEKDRQKDVTWSSRGTFRNWERNFTTRKLPFRGIRQ